MIVNNIFNRSFITSAHSAPFFSMSKRVSELICHYFSGGILCALQGPCSHPIGQKASVESLKSGELCGTQTLSPLIFPGGHIINCLQKRGQSRGEQLPYQALMLPVSTGSVAAAEGLLQHHADVEFLHSNKVIHVLTCLFN